MPLGWAYLVIYNTHWSDFSGCPSIDPAASAGVIYSPRFPWNYPNSKTCTWNITAPSWQMTHVNFVQFDLESSWGYCDTDYVEVRYGRYFVYSPKFCGYQIPAPVSHYGPMTVTFHSDSWKTYSGFLAFYQIGRSFPLATTAYPYTTYPYYTRRTASPYPPYPYFTPSPAQSHGACRPYSNNSKLSLYIFVVCV